MENKNTNSAAAAQAAVRYGEFCVVHPCRLARVATCNSCRLDRGMEDLCRFKPVRFHPRSELLKPSKPKTCKGFLPDFWMRRPTGGRGWVNHRENSKFRGYATAVDGHVLNNQGLEFIKKLTDLGTKVIRKYVGDDAMIKEKDLDNFKDGGYQPDYEKEPELITPYDAGLDPDDDMDEQLQRQYGTPDMWRQQGTVMHVVYQHSTHTNYVIAGSFSRRVKKVVYEPERTWIFYPPWGRLMMKVRTVRRELEYREDNVVMRKQELPTLHPILVGREKCVVGSSTVMTKKDRHFLEARKYGDRAVERHRNLLIHTDEVNSRKQVATATC